MHHQNSVIGFSPEPAIGDTLACVTCNENQVYNGSKFVHTHDGADKFLCADQRTDTDRIRDHFNANPTPEPKTERGFQLWCGRMGISAPLFGRTAWPTA